MRIWGREAAAGVEGWELRCRGQAPPQQFAVHLLQHSSGWRGSSSVSISRSPGLASGRAEPPLPPTDTSQQPVSSPAPLAGRGVRNSRSASLAAAAAAAAAGSGGEGREGEGAKFPPPNPTDSPRQGWGRLQPPGMRDRHRGSAGRSAGPGGLGRSQRSRRQEPDGFPPPGTPSGGSSPSLRAALPRTGTPR